jgi:FkbH-like protein
MIAKIDHLSSGAGPEQTSGQMILEHIERQSILFSRSPSFSKLLGAPISTRCPLRRRVGVYRNHLFEPALDLIKPYLAHAGIEADFWVSDYDESLTLIDLPKDLDSVILWIDIGRYRFSQAVELRDWLENRILALRHAINAEIIVSITASEVGIEPSVAHEISAICAKSLRGISFAPPVIIAATDEKRAERNIASASRLDRKQFIQVARTLGCRYLPPALMPRIKAIAVDLDNTLYKGVLGEDGIAGVVFSATQLDLISKLVELSDEGIFIIVVSKNESSDVEALFSSRSEFSELRSRLAMTIANWHAKSKNIHAAIDSLGIASNSVLFLDDNPGELFEVGTQIPDLRIVHANTSDCSTVDVLDQYPGLTGYKLTKEDRIRNDDFKAVQTRRKVESTTTTLLEYLQVLQAKITVIAGDSVPVERASQLSKKTNQFNSNFMRLEETDIRAMQSNPRKAIVCINYEDKLSDSGIIALFAGSFVNDDRCETSMNVDEIALSCRSLGRGVESLIIAHGLIRLGGDIAKTFSLRFSHSHRNDPARTWLDRHCELVSSNGNIRYTVSKATLQALAAPFSGVIKIEFR